MGTSLAHLISKRTRRPIFLYCVELDVCSGINNQNLNTKYLPGITLSKTIRAVSDIGESLRYSDTVFLAVPSEVTREVIAKSSPHFLPNTIILNTTKGIDSESLRPLIAVLPEWSGRTDLKWGVVGGPAIANEMAHGLPTELILGGSKSVWRRAVKYLAGDNIKISQTNDLVGVGLASALKNPYAIALGMCDGLKFTANSKASLLADAVGEMAQILKVSGAKKDTAYGLAGLGDLVATGFSPHSRNRTYGEKIATSNTKDPHALEMNTVEGIENTNLAFRLAKKFNLKTPLLFSIKEALDSQSDFSAPLRKYLLS